MPELTVDDVIRLTEALKVAGVPQFEGLGIKMTLVNAPKPRGKGQKVTPDAPEPKNAVDLALDNVGRAVEDDE